MIDEDYLCQIVYKTETITTFNELINNQKIEIKGLLSDAADNTRQIERLNNQVSKADELKDEKTEELATVTAQIELLEVENYLKNKKLIDEVKSLTEEVEKQKAELIKRNKSKDSDLNKSIEEGT